MGVFYFYFLKLFFVFKNKKNKKNIFKTHLFIIFENCFLFLTIIRITRKTGKTCLISGLFFLAPIFMYKKILFY